MIPEVRAGESHAESRRPSRAGRNLGNYEQPADERRALWRRRIAIFTALDGELAGEAYRGLGRIAFEQGRATAACELVVGAAAADVYGPSAGELAQGRRGGRQRPGRKRGDDDGVRREPTRRNLQRVGWHLAAEERDAPAAPAQHQ